MITLTKLKAAAKSVSEAKNVPCWYQSPQITPSLFARVAAAGDVSRLNPFFEDWIHVLRRWLTRRLGSYLDSQWGDEDLWQEIRQEQAADIFADLMEIIINDYFIDDFEGVSEASWDEVEGRDDWDEEDEEDFDDWDDSDLEDNWDEDDE